MEAKNPFEEERKRFCLEVCNENSHFADACHGACPLDGDSDSWYLDGEDDEEWYEEEWGGDMDDE